MQDIEEILKAPFPDGRDFPSCVIKSTSNNSKTLLASIDVVFVDLVFWLMNNVKGTSVGRDQIADLFATWVFGIWKTRPSAKMVVVLMERPRYIPYHKHVEGRSLVEETSEVDPFPHLWDNQNLGGFQGFQKWISDPQARLECMRTLVSDILNNHATYKDRIAPSDDRGIIFDCDLPGPPKVVWGDSKTDINDPELSGITGNTFSSLKRYIEVFEKTLGNDTLKNRSYELITDDPEWVTTTILYHFLKAGESFAGSAVYNSEINATWRPETRIWWHRDDPKNPWWFSTGGWYYLFKSRFIEQYEPLAGFLALVDLCKNPLLGATLFGRRSFTAIWKLFNQWQGERMSIDAQPMIAFIDPANDIVCMNWSGFGSFVLFLHPGPVNTGKALKDAEFNTKWLTDEPATAIKDSLKLWFGKQIDYLKKNSWKILIGTHASDPSRKLRLLPRTPSPEFVGKIQRFANKTEEWKNADFETFLASADFTGEEINLLRTHYGKTIQDSLVKPIDDLLGVFVGKEPFSVILARSLPVNDDLTSDINKHIEKRLSKKMLYIVEFKRCVRHAFLNTHWSLIYKTVGSHPYFLQKTWFSPEDWGWDELTGAPLVSKDVPTGVEDLYREKDKGRFESAISLNYYSWVSRFTGDDPSKPKIRTAALIKSSRDVAYTGLRLDGHGYLQYISNLGPHDLFALSGLFSTSLPSSYFEVPKGLWNAYMFTLAPFQKVNSKNLTTKNDRTTMQGFMSFPLFRTFEPYNAMLTTEGDEIDLAKNAFVDTIKKFFFSLVASAASIPWFAETWLSEVVERVWLFCYGLFVDSPKSPLRVSFSTTVNEILDENTFKTLARAGMLGRALDFFTEMLAAKMWPSNLRFFKTLVHDKKYVLLSRLRTGRTVALDQTIATVNQKRVPIVAGLKVLSKTPTWADKDIENYLTKKFVVRQIYNPGDNLYYTALVFLGTQSKPEPDPESALVTVMEYAGYMFYNVSNSRRWEQEWIIHGFTSTKSPNRPKAVYSTLWSTDITLVGDPQRLELYAPFARSEPLPGVLSIDGPLQHDREIIIRRAETFSMLDREERHPSKIRESHFIVCIFEEVDTLGINYLHTSCRVATATYIPASGVIYVRQNANIPCAVIFNSSIWSSKADCLSFIEKSGIPRRVMSIAITKDIRSGTLLPILKR